MKNGVSHKGVFNAGGLEKYQVSMPTRLYTTLLVPALVKSILEEFVADCGSYYILSRFKGRHGGEKSGRLKKYQHLSVPRWKVYYNMMCSESEYCGQSFVVIDISKSNTEGSQLYTGLADFDSDKVVFETSDSLNIGQKYRLNKGKTDTVDPRCEISLIETERVDN